MSTNDAVLPLANERPRTVPWQLWMNQVQTILKLELKRNLLTRRGLWIYLLAFAPVLIVFAHAVIQPRFTGGELNCTVDEDTTVLAGIFDVYYLRLGIFFGCMGIFTRLFRGEMMQKSLHYYFLSPVRRELLVIGKFLAGVVTAMLIFSVAVFACFALMYEHFGAPGYEYVFHGPGLAHLGAYLGVTLLACFGYGSIFILMGMLFQNPILPAVAILSWETVDAVLPSLLKKLSIIFYLRPLCPVEVPSTGLLQLFTVVADPLPAYLAVPGLLTVSLLALWGACWKVRRLEINYTTE